MSPTQIKICGLRRQEDIVAVNACKPDFAGFVFAPGKRQVSPGTARDLISRLDSSILAAGVFVSEPDELICQITASCGLRVVQLHGTPMPGRVRLLREMLGRQGTSRVMIWQCLPIPAGTPADLAVPEPGRLPGSQDPADRPDTWLLDSQHAGRTGGTGIRFDWRIASGFASEHPVVLAGGLNPDNVAEALSILHPAVVDCSSGVETDGLKDLQKMQDFCRSVHDFDRRKKIVMKTAAIPIWPDARGRFGRFGGRYAAETLMPALAGLEQAYREAQADPDFQAQLRRLLCDYAGRPSLLYHAERLSGELGLTVLLKREDLNHTGSHKINNVLGQVLLASRMGKRSLIAETGAGQHGVAAATAAALFGFSCDVFMGAEDTRRQALNVYRMELLGARVHPVTAGTATLKDATSEAMREWSRRAGEAFYVIGSTVGPHPYPMIVRDFQRVIGDEIRAQSLERHGCLPDALIACVGGGSNAAGTFHPFENDRQVRLFGAEAGGEGIGSGRHAATLSCGSTGIFHGMRSLFLQDGDGQILPVHSISAGLDYPGVGPEHAWLQDMRRVSYHAVTDREAAGAFEWLSRLEGIIPAIESAHALALLRKLAHDGVLARGSMAAVTLSGRGDKDVESIQAWQREQSTLLTNGSSKGVLDR